MFTGIIEEKGVVTAVEAGADAIRLSIRGPLAVEGVRHGDSIAVSGVCLTVVDKGALEDGTGWFAVDVSGETQSRTPASTWLEGSALNLERSLRVGDEMGGHIVTGHVDGTGEVLSVTPEGGSLRVTIAAPPLRPTGRSLWSRCFHSGRSPSLVGMAQYSSRCGPLASDPPTA